LVGVGQLTPTRELVVPLATERHVVPARVSTVPLLPTAMHVELFGHFTPPRYRVVPELSSAHVVPSLVDMTSPFVPTTTQPVVLQQLIPTQVVSACARGFDWYVHVTPPSPLA
jgi:hypothetical protein